MSRAFLKGGFHVEIRGRSTSGRWTLRFTLTHVQAGQTRQAARRDSLSRSRPRSLATLVNPTMSTPVQDNISLIPRLVFHLASTHLGKGMQQQIHWSVDGPHGSKMLTVGAPGRGSLRVNEHFPVEFQMGSLQQPL
jgi:hypothetical protein